MDLEVTLTEKYSYNPVSEFLLVINQDTPSELIVNFKNFAIQLGSTCDVWNATNYWGFSYD